MTAAVLPSPALGVFIPRPRKTKSPVHRIALALVWLTVAFGGFVFVEPAPVDALTGGLLVLLPIVGLTTSKPALNAAFAVWLVIAAFAMLSVVVSREPSEGLMHTIVSLHLYAACFLFALFVAKRPFQHTRLILSAYLAANVVVASLGIIGYLDLIPGTFDLFTVHGRATATFKDPNVYGPYLICGLLTALHVWLSRPPVRGAPALVAAVIITVGLLFSFSRGAWAAAIAAVVIYVYLYMLTAERSIQRIKLAGAALLGAALVGLVVAAAVQSDSVARLLEERASLFQSYDSGVEGRFGGQGKAIDLILENPLGIGFGIFGRFFHHEAPHNIYLSMMLNAGWIGGLLYFLLCAATLALGLQHALRRTRTQPLFLIVYAALAGNMLEGFVIDSDHWRHFYLLTGVVWGLMAGDRKIPRRARIVRDRRPVLLQTV